MWWCPAARGGRGSASSRWPRCHILRSNATPALGADGRRCSAELGEQAQRHVHRQRVSDGGLSQDVAGADALAEELHHLLAALLGEADAPRVHGGDGAVAGSASPSASVRQFMELAVNYAAQEPQPGQADSSTSRSSASPMVPALIAPTASNTCSGLAVEGKHGTTPRRTGSAVQPRRRHPHAGHVLVAVGMNTSASKQWAPHHALHESAITRGCTASTSCPRGPSRCRRTRRWC